jgi:hypothetical protein
MRITDIIRESSQPSISSDTVEFPSDSRGQSRETGLSQPRSQDQIDRLKNVSPKTFSKWTDAYGKDPYDQENPINYLPDNILKPLLSEKNLMAAFSSPGNEYRYWREWIEIFPDSAFTPRSAKHLISIDPCVILYGSYVNFGPEYVNYALDVANKLLEKGDDASLGKVEDFIENAEDGEDIPFIDNPEISSKFNQLRQNYSSSAR